MTRRQTRALYVRAFQNWNRYRTLKWEAEMQRWNLELMKMSSFSRRREKTCMSLSSKAA